MPRKTIEATDSELEESDVNSASQQEYINSNNCEVPEHDITLIIIIIAQALSSVVVCHFQILRGRHLPRRRRPPPDERTPPERGTPRRHPPLVPTVHPTRH